MSTKFTNSDIQAKLNSMFGKNEYKLISKYIKNDIPVKLKHSCGLVFEANIAEVTRKNRPLVCPCLRVKNTNRTTKSHDIEIKAWRGSDYHCVKYVGNRSTDKNTYYHDVCGEQFKSSMNNFKLSINCPICNPTASSNVKDNKRFQNDLNEKFGKDEYKIVSKYINNENPVTVEHKCGIKSTFNAHNLLAGTAKCRCLHKKDNFRTLKSHNEEIKTWANKQDWVCVEYNGAQKINHYKHIPCGNITKKTIFWFKATLHCEHCVENKFHNTSKLTRDQVQDNLNLEFGEYEYIIIGNFKSFSKHKTLIHHSCGTDYRSSLISMFKGESLCPTCYSNGNAIKHITIEGKKHPYQGYENISIKHLLKTHDFKQIKSCHNYKVPKFDYVLNGTRSNYTPDFYIPSSNLIVETKSIATFGLIEPVERLFGKNLIARNQAKAKAVLKKGYKFKLHLWHRNKLVKLPVEWYLMPPEQLKKNLLAVINPVKEKKQCRLTLSLHGRLTNDKT